MESVTSNSALLNFSCVFDIIYVYRHIMADNSISGDVFRIIRNGGWFI